NSLGRFGAHRRVIVLVFMVLVMAALSIAGSMFGKPFGQGGVEEPDSGWATAEQLEQEAYGRDALGDVVVSYHAPDGTAVDDPAFLDPIRESLDTILENFRVIEDQIAVDGVETDIAGLQPVAGALQDGMDADLVRAELIALPLVFLLLIVVFGGVVAAFLPVAVGVLTILGSLGALHLLS